jgi:hypothetical protein
MASDQHLASLSSWAQRAFALRPIGLYHWTIFSSLNFQSSTVNLFMLLRSEGSAFPKRLEIVSAVCFRSVTSVYSVPSVLRTYSAHAPAAFLRE